MTTIAAATVNGVHALAADGLWKHDRPLSVRDDGEDGGERE